MSAYVSLQTLKIWRWVVSHLAYLVKCETTTSHFESSEHCNNMT